MKIKTKNIRGILGLGILLWHTCSFAQVTPQMDHTTILQILQNANAGDTILFAEGTYKGNYALEDLHGEPNRALVIRGEGADRSIIDGESEPGSGLKHHAFSLVNCSWISIEGFTMRNCWTDLVRAENSSWISLRSCKLYGGKRALFATGRDSHHFLIEQCTWEQEKRVWSHEDDYSWDEIHHGIHKHYNGSLFQGNKISGVFVLREGTPSMPSGCLKSMTEPPTSWPAQTERFTAIPSSTPPTMYWSRSCMSKTSTFTTIPWSMATPLSPLPR